MSVEDSGLLNRNIEESNNEEEQNASKENNETIQERLLTDLEKEQVARGWDPDGVKSAEEYARSEPLYEEIKKRGKEIKSLHKTVEGLKQYMERQEKVVYDKARSELQVEWEKAVSAGNVALVKQKQKELDELKPNLAQIPDAVKEFHSKYEKILNSREGVENKIRLWLMGRDSSLASEGLTPDEHLAQLESEMSEIFPSYFSKLSPGQSVEAGIGSNVSSSGGKRKYNFNDLSKDQKGVWESFEKYGVPISKDKYVQSLVEQGVLK